MLFRHNRPAALIAAFAMALNALWPLVAQAQPKNPALIAVICSSEGGTHAVDLSGKAPGGAGGGHDHCKLCIAGGDRAAAILQKLDTVFNAVPAQSPGISRFTSAQFSSSFDSPAQPRAPPPIL